MKFRSKFQYLLITKWNQQWGRNYESYSFYFQTLNKEALPFSNTNLKFFGENFIYEAHKVNKQTKNSDDTLIK